MDDDGSLNEFQTLKFQVSDAKQLKVGKQLQKQTPDRIIPIPILMQETNFTSEQISDFGMKFGVGVEVC